MTVAVLAPGMAAASVRPGAAAFSAGSNALKSGERKSQPVAADNQLNGGSAAVALLATAAAGLGLYWALHDNNDKPISPS